MLFTEIEQFECSDTCKGVNAGFYRMLNGRDIGLTGVTCINQKTSFEDSCPLCAVSQILSQREEIELGYVQEPPKKKRKKKKKNLSEYSRREETIPKVDDGVEFPKCLVSPCEQCINNDEVLKQQLQDIMSFWFKDDDRLWNVSCKFRKIVDEGNQKFLPTYQLVLLQPTNTTFTIVIIPIAAVMKDSPLILHRSYAFVYDEPQKLLTAYLHKDFADAVPEKAFGSSREIVDKKFTDLKSSLSRKMPLQKTVLVDKDEYLQLYRSLKEKYMRKFIEIWSDVCRAFNTIAKGISIAAYLLLLWENERKETNSEVKQTFVHIQCGSGLLVYILTNEGHPGKGIDVVRHKMWDNYDNDVEYFVNVGADIVLEEKTVHPHKLKVDADWVICSDADQLSPWIPVIAAQSASIAEKLCETSFFLIPCCQFGLNGSIVQDFKRYPKFRSYPKYLDYLVDIGKKCGFTMVKDQILYTINEQSCLIGHKRSAMTLPLFGESEMLINKELKEFTEINCFVKNELYEVLFRKLLSSENYSYSGEEENKVTSFGHKWSEWNAGTSLPLSEIEKLVNPDALKKFEGIEKVLFGQMFTLCDGMVSLTDYRNGINLRDIRRRRARNHKKFDCSFHRCHPQGCVLSAEECHDIHTMEEMNSFYFY